MKCYLAAGNRGLDIGQCERNNINAEVRISMFGGDSFCLHFASGSPRVADYKLTATTALNPCPDSDVRFKPAKRGQFLRQGTSRETDHDYTCVRVELSLLLGRSDRPDRKRLPLPVERTSKNEP